MKGFRKTSLALDGSRKYAREARLHLQEGESRQKVFDQLTEKLKDPRLALDVLKDIPQPQALKQYQIWNYLLLGLIVGKMLLFLGKENEMLDILTLAVFCTMIYVVAGKKMRYYPWVTFWSVVSVVAVVALILLEDLRDWRAFALAALGVASAVLSVWIRDKICPPAQERKEEYVDPKGIKRFRKVFEFPEY